MMKIQILCIFLFGVLGASIAVPLDSSEEDARAFLQSASLKYFTHFDKLNDEIFDDKEDTPDQINNLQVMLKTASKLVEIVDESKKFDDSKFTDPELKHIFKNIRRSAGEAVLGKKNVSDMLLSLSLLSDMAIEDDIPAYKNVDLEIALLPDIQNIFEKSNDPEELKYYWTIWRQRNGVWAIVNFINIYKNMKEAARLTNITPLEYWLRDYNMADMERIMMQIKPLYLEMHAFIRKELQKKYGDNIVKSDGPIPDHLFQQVLMQAWSNNSFLESMYPLKDLPQYEGILEKNNYNTEKMYKMADKFYQSMGFAAIPEEYWGNHLMMSPRKDYADCTPTIFDKTPIVYMYYCQRMDFRTFLQAHGYMGELYYAMEKKDLPAYYFDAYNLQYPVGEAVLMSASTPKHLKAIGLVDDYKYNIDVEMNRLLRMGINTLLNVPMFFVQTKVMADLFAEKIDVTDLNKHYWKLMDEYVGVAPPVERGAEALDFPYKFYFELSKNKQARKFMSEILGYQFYERMCEISGQYSKTMPNSEPMQNCDFYGSKDAGAALMKMMKLGSSKPLRDVLATMMPENPTVNAESLLEYYSPMKTFLAEKNHEEDVIVGWKHSDMSVSKTKIVFTEDDE